MNNDPLAKTQLTQRQAALVKIMAPQQWADYYERKQIANGEYFTLVEVVTYAIRITKAEGDLLKLLFKAQAAAAKHSNATTRYHQYAGFETGRKAHERADHWWNEFQRLMSEMERIARGEPHA